MDPASNAHESDINELDHADVIVMDVSPGMNSREPTTYELPEEGDLLIPKMGTSLRWNVIQLSKKYPNFAYCTLCKKWMSYKSRDPSNLNRHLHDIHPNYKEAANSLPSQKLKQKI